MLDHLVSGAKFAASHISVDNYSHPWLDIILRHQCLCFGHPVVPGLRGVVILLQDLEDEGCGCRWNGDAALGVQEPVLERVLTP